MKNHSDQKTYRDRLHRAIPGGCHTYSRGDDQFPYNAPAILTKGNGAYVYDINDEEFLDYGMGLRSVNIGYGNKEIADACYAEIIKGNNLTRASITELEAAELLIATIPSIEMVKFAKHGSVVTTAAMKLARAYTNKKYIAVPVEHPFYSYDDWFIGSTVMSKGVPEEISKFTLKFNFNNIDSLKTLFEQYPNQIAAVMTEPATSVGPTNNFLHEVKHLCKKNNTIFILDEMITGFRWHLSGAQTYFNIEPDLCTFGKAMANGFAVAALGGKRDIMNIGGILKENQERVFLTSTTHGAEMSSLGAFIKTVEILKRENVIQHIWDYGTKLMKGLNEISRDLGIADHFFVEGYPCSPSYVTKDEELNISLPFRTLFSQEMLEKKIMIPYIAISFSHRDVQLEKTLDAAKSALSVYQQALNTDVNRYLKSTVIKPVFRKYN